MRGRARARGRGARGLRALGGPRDRDRRGDRHAGGCGCSTARRSSATCRWRRWSTSARSTTSSPLAPARADLPGAARAASPESRPGRAPARAARLAPTSPRAARCSSSTTASWLAHGAPARAGRRRGARARPDGRGGLSIAVSIDGNGRRVAADPYRGAVEAVLECAANLACVGAEPLGLTNCLNFGNPEKPHIAWQLTRAVAGLGDACRALGVPGRRRQRLALQRGRRGADLPDAGRRHGRRAARPGARRPLGFAAAGRRDRADRRRVRRRRWTASELAKLRGEPLPERRCRRVDLRELRALHAAIREAVRARRAGSRARRRRGRRSPSRWPSAASPAASARLVGSSVADEALLFGEGPGGFVVSGPRRGAAARSARTHACSARSAATRSSWAPESWFRWPPSRASTGTASHA